MEKSSTSRKKPRFTLRTMPIAVFAFALISLGAARWYDHHRVSRSSAAELALDPYVSYKHVTVISSVYENPICRSGDKVFRGLPQPYIHLSKPTLTKNAIRSLLPELRVLLPHKGYSHIAIYLHPEIFADSEFRKELDDQLPHCLIYEE